MLKMAKLDAYG